jgi:hypothetical protein
MDRKTRREIVATLVKQGRRDLAKQFVGAGGGYWSYEVNKGLEGWWQSLFHSMRAQWESIKFMRVSRGGGATFWWRQMEGEVAGQEFTIAVLVSPTAGPTKLSVEAKILDGPQKGKKKSLGTISLSAQPYEAGSMVSEWLATVWKQELGRT